MACNAPPRSGQWPRPAAASNRTLAPRRAAILVPASLRQRNSPPGRPHEPPMAPCGPCSTTRATNRPSAPAAALRGGFRSCLCSAALVCVWGAAGSQRPFGVAVATIAPPRRQPSLPCGPPQSTRARRPTMQRICQRRLAGAFRTVPRSGKRRAYHGMTRDWKSAMAGPRSRPPGGRRFRRPGRRRSAWGAQPCGSSTTSSETLSALMSLLPAFSKFTVIRAPTADCTWPSPQSGSRGLRTRVPGTSRSSIPRLASESPLRKSLQQ